MHSSLALALLAGYLLGSIPFAHLIARSVKGLDLARVGSRNVGTRNLSRSVGAGWGALGGALDFGKGLAAMALGQALAGGPPAASSPLWMLAGVAAVVGHNWPVWLHFRGGKGLATAMGAAAWVALWPELVIAFALGWVAMRITGNITLAAIAGIAALLMSLQFLGKPIEVTWLVLSLAATVLLAALADLRNKP